MRYVILFLFFLPIFSTAANAQDVSDSIHETISNSIATTADYIDDFFTNERRNVEGSKSRVIMSFVNLYDKDKLNTQNYNIDARLRLPKTENRFHLFIKNTLSDDTTDQQTTFQDQTAQEAEQGVYTAALQYVFTESRMWRVSTRAGMTLGYPLNPFVKLRLRRLTNLILVDNRLIQEFRWSEIDHFTETSTVEFERLFNEDYFSRLHLAVKWGENDREWQHVGDLSLFYKLKSSVVTKYTVGYESLLTHGFDLKRVFVNFHYRRNFLKKWMFFEVVPEFFREETDWNKTRFQFLFKLDLVFGK
ncbi:MAG: hypothetical protein R3240_05170 [Gammaproteobacteria bacterium]|nr:hypothetical protein [Gammaproteobacteria bacterium]